MDISSFLKSFKASRAQKEAATQLNEESTSAHSRASTTPDHAADALSECFSRDSSDTDEEEHDHNIDEEEDDVLRMSSGGGARLAGRRRQRHQLSAMLEQDRVAGAENASSLEEAIERNTLGSLKIMSTNVVHEKASEAQADNTPPRTGMDVQACRKRLLQMQRRQGGSDTARQSEKSNRNTAAADVFRAELQLARTRRLRAKEHTAPKSSSAAHSTVKSVCSPHTSSLSPSGPNETTGPEARAMLDIDDLLSNVSGTSPASVSEVTGSADVSSTLSLQPTPTQRTLHESYTVFHSNGKHDSNSGTHSNDDAHCRDDNTAVAISGSSNENTMHAVAAAAAALEAPQRVSQTEFAGTVLEAISTTTPAQPVKSTRKVSLFKRARNIISSAQASSS